MANDKLCHSAQQQRGSTRLVVGALTVVSRAGQDSDAAQAPPRQGHRLRVQHVHSLRHMKPVEVDRSPLKYLLAASIEGGRLCL